MRSASDRYSSDGKPWSLETKANVGACMVALGKTLYKRQGGRRQAAERGLSAYYARPFKRMSASDLHEPEVERYFSLTPARAILDTAKAKIACKQRPKAVALTNGGNYRQRLQAKQLSKFMAGVLHQRQGKWANTWELGEMTFLDCLRWEAGVIKVTPDYDRNRIIHERCYPYDLLFDEYESEHGDPQNLMHVYRYDRYNLAEVFPDSHRDDIMHAAPFPSDGSPRADRNADMVAVWEAWRLPFSKSKPGRRVMAVEGQAGKTLIDDPWEHEQFPFAILTCTPAPYGMMGDPMIDQIVELQEELNGLVNELHENVRLQSGGYIAYDPSAFTGDAEEALATNLPFKLVPVTPGSNPSAAFHVNTPPPFHPSMMSFVEFLRASCYEFPGVSELSSQGRREPGVDAAVALRTMNDLQTERFLPQSRAYEQLYATLGQLDLMAAEDLMKRNKTFSIQVPNNGALDEIDFDKVRMDADAFVVTVQASSSTEDTLAGRRQAITELTQAGYISPERAEEMLTSANPDVTSMNKIEQAQRRYLDKLIASFQEYTGPDDDAPDEDDESDEPMGDDDVAEMIDNKSPFEAPDPALNLDAAIIQMSEGYWEAKADGAPEENLQLFRDWISLADDEIAKRQQAAAPPAPPMGGPSIGPGPEMMGGMPPMDPAMMDPAMAQMAPPM